MAEYIDRDALIADIEKRYCKPCEAECKDYNHVRCRACWVDDAMGEIENAPAADVKPVVKGRWKSVGLASLECSECGYADYEKMYHRYCPDCGAFMR